MIAAAEPTITLMLRTSYSRFSSHDRSTRNTRDNCEDRRDHHEGRYSQRRIHETRDAVTNTAA